MRGEKQTNHIFNGGVDRQSTDIADAGVMQIGRRVEFGNTSSEWTRLSDLNRLEQTRQSYDPEAIRELADSMVLRHNDSVTFELINDIQVGVFDDSELRSFLVDYEHHYGFTVDLGHLAKGSDGLWHIAIAGHRRSIAIELLCKEHAIDPREAFFSSYPRRGISFEDFLVCQLRENIHVRPPKVDEARQIQLYYAARTKRDGKRPTYISCSNVLGFSPEVISEAVRFSRLPIEVQHEAAASMISYSHAVALTGYTDTLELLYKRKYAIDLEDDEAALVVKEHVMHSAMTAVKKIKEMGLRGKTAEDKTLYIKQLINNARLELGGEDQSIDGLMVFEETPETMHRRANARVLGAAIDVIMRWGASGEINESQVQRLFELAQAAKKERHSRAIHGGETFVDPDELDFADRAG